MHDIQVLEKRSGNQLNTQYAKYQCIRWIIKVLVQLSSAEIGISRQKLLQIPLISARDLKLHQSVLKFPTWLSATLSAYKKEFSNIFNASLRGTISGINLIFRPI